MHPASGVARDAIRSGPTGPSRGWYFVSAPVFPVTVVSVGPAGLRLARIRLASHRRCARDFTALTEVDKRRRGQCEGRQRSGDCE